jgi:hypothetical protein
VATTALLGFVAPVESQSIEYRETNAERFARGMPPLPPSKRTETNGASKKIPLFLLSKVNMAANDEGQCEQSRSALSLQNVPPLQHSSSRSVPIPPSVLHQYSSSVLNPPSGPRQHSRNALSPLSDPRQHSRNVPGHPSVLLRQPS